MASGEAAAASKEVNSRVPWPSTVSPGRNFKVEGLGVASVWMNIAQFQLEMPPAGGSVTPYMEPLREPIKPKPRYPRR